MTTRRPRIGLINGQYAAFEVLDDNGDVIWYSDSIDGSYEWPLNRDFTPLAEVPEPRMDEPQETWETVVASTSLIPDDLSVFYHEPGGLWRRIRRDGPSMAALPWRSLIDPRPTTPTERATGIVGGEDQ